MHMKKFIDDEEDEGYEGFEKNPVISEEIIVQSSQLQGTFYPFNSIVHERKKKPSRYASQQKPGFKLKALDQATRLLKNSQNFKKHRHRESQEAEQIEMNEVDNCQSPVYARKFRKMEKDRSKTHLQEMIEGAIIKSKKAEAIENITISTDPKQRENIIKEQIAMHPNSEVVYRQKMPESTFSYFKKMTRNSQKSTFMESKYNRVLRGKLERTKVTKQDLTIPQRPRVANCIQFTGDFQSGNLDFVLKIDEDEYNIFLRIDTNTRGHQSWFYFKASNNFNETKRIQLNICNVKRRFRMIQSGQRVHVKDVNNNGQWKNLDEEIQVSPYGKKKFKLSFSLTLKPHQEIMVSLIPPYTYSDLLKDLQTFDCSPNVKIDTLTHTITGLAVPLITITKGAGDKRKVKSIAKKKLLLITGRIHPSQTCSSYIINGIVRELIQNEAQFAEFLSHNIIKIIPMLNPDGVIFGNFRTNYLGDDLNRSFHKCDETVFPETTALKQLGKQYVEQYGDNFIGYLDMHGHSGQTNSFVYGPEYEENSQSFVQCRILPKIIDKLSKYFKYEMSEFKLQEYKSNTARGYFFKKLKVPSYTIETSYALYKDKKDEESIPKTMSVSQWKEYGQEITQSIVAYFKYLQLVKEEKSIFKRGKDKKATIPNKNRSSHNSCIDFFALKKEVQKENSKVNRKAKLSEQQSEDSDGQSLEEDLPQSQKQVLVKKIKQMTAPSFLLPKVQKPSLNLPSVIPSMQHIGRSEEKVVSMMPKLVNKYRNKKLVRPMNLSYEYTQYLLKNISDIGSLKPEVLQFSNEGRKRGAQTTMKKQSIIQF